MINLKKTASLAAAVLLSVTTLVSGLTASASGASVRMNALRSTASETIAFTQYEPVMHNDTLFIPVRSFSDYAGMEVSWDQTTETAILSINLTEQNKSPIQEYGNELISKVSGYGLEISPTGISAALTAGNNTAVLRFMFTDSDGSEIAIGKTIQLSSSPYVIDDKALMVPLRDTASIFGLNTDWDQNTLSVQISLPDFTIVPTNMSIIPVHSPAEEISTIYSEEVTEDAPVQENNGTYLGRFKITHYCTCSICNGGWGNHTAYADEIIPGQTIAVDPNVIPPLSWVYIDGYGLRRAEDCGGAINGYHIDMAVSSHAEAYSLGVVYKDVWLQ